MKERNLRIDIMRGMCVLGTLIAHANQRSLTVLEGILFPDNLITKLIYPWFMTLFMVLSGYTLGYSENYNLRKKAFRLILPTFVWSIVLWAVQGIPYCGISFYFDFDSYTLLGYIKMLFLNPTYVVWFLWIVFVLTLILYLLNWLVKFLWGGAELDKSGMRMYTAILAVVVFWLISLVPIKNYFGLYYISYYWFFFLIGWVMHVIPKHRLILPRLTIILIIVGLLVKILNLFQIVDADQSKVNTWLSIGIIYLISVLLDYIHKKTFLKYPIRVLVWFGQHSLEIYLFQLVCLNFGWGENKYLRFTTTFIMATIISSALSFGMDGIRKLIIKGNNAMNTYK